MTVALMLWQQLISRYITKGVSITRPLTEVVKSASVTLYTAIAMYHHL